MSPVASGRPAPLRDVLTDLGPAPRTSVLHVRAGGAPVTGTTEVLLVDGDEAPPDGWTYLLETAVAQEVLEVWSASHDERSPTASEACAAVAFSAANDAYLSDDDEPAPGAETSG